FQREASCQTIRSSPCSVVKKKSFSFEIGRRRVIKGWDEGVVQLAIYEARHQSSIAPISQSRKHHNPSLNFGRHHRLKKFNSSSRTSRARLIFVAR
ncbi:MAG TPA: hypothetical protein EYO88_10480, partial [Alphaproteobacteria bacterium]|nr:hypothetical protein [Alphaproteobacteria bacterium]